MNTKLLIATLALAGSAAVEATAQDPPPDTYTLARAVATALRQSPAVRDARLGLKAASEQVREAWSKVFPDVSGTASYDRNVLVQEAFLPAVIFDPAAPPEELIPVRFGSDNIWRASVVASQPLFQLDVLIGVGAANRFHDLQTEAVRGTAQEVVTAVRMAYFNALIAAEEVRLNELSVERVRRTLDETRALNRAGLASDYDVLRLQVQLANLEPALRRAQLGADAARRTVQVEIGLDPEVSIALAGHLHELDLEDPTRNEGANAELLTSAGARDVALADVARLQEDALRARSDLRQVRLNVALEEARLASQRSEYFPKLSAFSSYTVTAQQNGSPDFFGERPNQRTEAAVFGLRVELPIFSGFARSARMQQTRARIGQLEARSERLALETASQLRTLAERVAEARLRAIAQRGAVAQATRGFEIASAEYRAGVGSQLQITDAELALRQSEFNYALAVHDYLTARAQLDAAAGAAPSSPAEVARRP